MLKLVEEEIENHHPDAVFDRAADHDFARHIAEECAVLLKNKDSVLPLTEGSSVALIGDFDAAPRYQGGGSSHVNSAYISRAMDCMPKGMSWTRGYDQGSDTSDRTLLEEAVAAARKADAAVILAGLPERYESEGVDRTTLEMPANQNELIEAVSDVQPNTIVVLYNGAPITMPWLDKVAAVLEMYLPGDGVGAATMDLLYGGANPSGKLPETFPQKLAHTPSWFNFPGENGITEYREGVFVGYRYYDAKEMDVLFPFGYGLSYTSFAYSNMTVDRSRMREGETLRVQLTVTNTGKLPGKEVVQLYVAPPAGMRRRPVRELKSFAKLELQPGERREITFQLNARDLAYYEPLLHDFYAPTGCYGIEVGASSRDIRLRKEVSFTAERPLPRMFTEYSTLADVVSDSKGAAVFGPILQRLADAAAGQASAGDTEGASRMLEGMTLGTLVSFGVLTEEQLKGMLEGLNG